METRGNIPHSPAKALSVAPLESQATSTLPSLYGATVFDDAIKLETDVASASTLAAAYEAIDAFSCRYPPLHRNVLGELERKQSDPTLTTAKVAGALAKRRKEWQSGARYTIRSDNGEFELPPSGKCSCILLGRSTKADTRDFFMDADVINHELGHSMHYALWASSGGVPSD